MFPKLRNTVGSNNSTPATPGQCVCSYGYLLGELPSLNFPNKKKKRKKTTHPVRTDFSHPASPRLSHYWSTRVSHQEGYNPIGKNYWKLSSFPSPLPLSSVLKACEVSPALPNLPWLKPVPISPSKYLIRTDELGGARKLHIVSGGGSKQKKRI